jgi:hypothetical protein
VLEGFVQNIKQLEISYETNKRKKRKRDNDDDFDYLYGVMTLLGIGTSCFILQARFSKVANYH